MKTLQQSIILLLGIALCGVSLAANDPLKKAIKARQGEMQLRSFYAGPLFGMAKGEIEYDAAMASALAADLKRLTELDLGRAWPQGSDNEAYPGKTTALPKIWTTYPEISEYGKRYVQAVNELADSAGGGLDALRGGVRNLGKSCKGCHDDFREKK